MFASEFFHSSTCRYGSAPCCSTRSTVPRRTDRRTSKPNPKISSSRNQASTKIASESGRFGNKAGKLVNAQSWDRQRDDIKDVIEEIASILDDKNVHWTIRVGVTL